MNETFEINATSRPSRFRRIVIAAALISLAVAFPMVLPTAHGQEDDPAGDALDAMDQSDLVMRAEEDDDTTAVEATDEALSRNLDNTPAADDAKTADEESSDQLLVPATVSDSLSSLPSGTTAFFDGSSSDGATFSGSTTAVDQLQFHEASDSDGNTVQSTSTGVGQFEFHDLSASDGTSATGTSDRIGVFEFHDLSLTSSNSIEGTSMQIGNFTFHDFTDSNGQGTRGTTITIGDTVFTDFDQ